MSGHSGQLDDGSSPTMRTVFRIASMTKPFTAATVLRLRDDGVLALDEPVPDLPIGPDQRRAADHAAPSALHAVGVDR